MAIAVVLAVILVFAIDLTLTHGKTARGAAIAEFGADAVGEAEAAEVIGRLRVAAAGPVMLRTEYGTVQAEPDELGLSFDAEATLARLLRQPRNPVTRLSGMFGARYDVLPVVHVDPDVLDEGLRRHAGELERDAAEGGVHFEDAVAVADFPAPGLRVDRHAAAAALARDWLTTGPVALTLESFSPTVSEQAVRDTMAGPAAAVVSAPVALTGAGQRFTVSPAELGELITFGPDGDGGLTAVADPERVARMLGDRVKRAEQSPVSASFRLAGGAPAVVPGRVGRSVSWEPTTAAIVDAAVGTGRTAEIGFDVTPPRLTTQAARELGVRELVSEYTTGGFSGPSGENIRLTAQQVDGALVLPGETFSLNDFTGPRGSAQGYVSSGIIDHGRPSTAVGGGISQFATTLYNAAYFAGLEDITHTEHAYYISRYPEAREATVFEGLIDLAFKNNTPYGILITTDWSPSSVTVQLWSTKHLDVESVTGERYAYTSPETVELPAGADCVPSGGAGGFTTSNTRIIRDRRTGHEVYRHTRTVRYAPEPIVHCR